MGWLYNRLAVDLGPAVAAMLIAFFVILAITWLVLPFVVVSMKNSVQALLREVREAREELRRR
jgi:ABC-type spermidine/putrescine transport system permease subunit I